MRQTPVQPHAAERLNALILDAPKLNDAVLLGLTSRAYEIVTEHYQAVTGSMGGEGVRMLIALEADITDEIDRVEKDQPKVVRRVDLDRLSFVAAIATHLCRGVLTPLLSRHVHSMWDDTWDDPGYFAIDRIATELYGWLDQIEEETTTEGRRTTRANEEELAMDDLVIVCSIAEMAIGLQHEVIAHGLES